jgi:hypothetical protein
VPSLKPRYAPGGLQQALLEFIASAGPSTPVQAALGIEHRRDAVRATLARLHGEGRLTKDLHARYDLVRSTP